MNNTKNVFRKRIAMVLMLVIVVSLLAACSQEKIATDDTKRVLRIATIHGDGNYTDHLRTQYTDLFAFQNKNIEIQFVSAIDYSKHSYGGGRDGGEYKEPDPIEEMKKLMDGDTPPDLVFLDLNIMPALVEDNLLLPLDQKIAEDKFDVSDFVPAVIDGLRSLGNNQLYALAPTFTSQALIYNKALFTAKDVPFPVNGMNWEEIFEKARLLTSGEGEEKISGFAFNQQMYSNLYHDMQVYMAPLELRIFDDDQESILVDSPAWNEVWQRMFDLDQLGIFPEAPDENMMYKESRIGGSTNPYMHDSFLSGKTAMTIIHYDQLNQIIAANRNADTTDGYTAIDWDVVSVPVHEQYPNIGGYVHMDPIMGINANAENIDDAWAFIKFMNGEEWASFKSESTNNMVSRKEFIKPKAGINYNVEAFYTLEPAPYNTNMRGGYNEAYWRVESIGMQKFQQVLKEEISVTEALQQWETEGNNILQQIKENPDGGGGIGVPEPFPMPRPVEGIIDEEPKKEPATETNQPAVN